MCRKEKPTKIFVDEKKRCLSVCILCYHLCKKKECAIYFYVPVTLLSSLHVLIHHIPHNAIKVKYILIIPFVH